ncbi:MAG: RICIN domain-containing protein [Burkholderiaceae bacterium]
MFSKNIHIVNNLSRLGVAAVVSAIALLPCEAAVAAPTTIVSKLSGKCLDVIGGPTATGNGARLEQWSCVTGAGNQAFNLVPMTNNQYELVSQLSGKCVEVIGGSTANGAMVDQYDCRGTPQQLWKLNSVSGGQQIISAVSNKCLDVVGGVTALSDGAYVEQWDCAANAGNQTWTITNGVPTTTSSSTTTTSPGATTTTSSGATTTTASSGTTTTKPVTTTTQTVTTTTIPPQACGASYVTPAVATQAQWDAKYNAQYGTSLPNTSGGAEDFAWQGHYWVRSYVSMAKTYGDTKYLDTASRMIDFWLAHTDGPQGWGTSLGASQMSLDTGVISEAIMTYAYEVWKDPRFAAYRTKADSYIAKLEPILNSYNNQWVNSAPYAGSPGFYVYASCGGICSSASLMMYNQGTVLAKPLMLIDRVKRMKGQTPDPAYLNKADKVAAYFKTFARLNNNAYDWDYGGARGSGIEDASHAHLDLSHLVWAKQFGLGGLTNTDMTRLANTMQKVLNGQAGSNDVSHNVDGTGLPGDNYLRVSVGYDWIDLVDYDATLLDKTIKVFNTYMSNPSSARFYLGWAEIQRKKSCVSLF